MISIRLTEHLEKALAEYCSLQGLPKSQVVKEALAVYLNKQKASLTPYEAGSDLFGTEGSGSTDKSKTYKKLFSDLLNEKYSH